MKQHILVTGVSGTGKSTLAETFRALGYRAHDTDDIPDLFTMVHKGTTTPVADHDNADLEKVKNMDWICDVEKLKKLIASETELTFYCGAASNMDDILPLFDAVFLVTVDEETMRARLSTRITNDYGKTAEVQDFIMSYKEWWENDMMGKGAVRIDGHGRTEDTARSILKYFAKD